MSIRILVYSPDVELGRMLADALRAESGRLKVQVSERYPTEREIEMSDQGGVGAIVVGLTGEFAGLETIKNFRSVAPAIPTVAAGRSESSSELLDAMRAGATDYLWPPFGSERLANLLGSLPARAGRTKANHLVCFLPCQPTDGASTIALHVAHALPGVAGVKPLLLDCDIHSSTLAFRLGTKFDFHLGHALERLSDLDDIWTRVAADWNGFFILPCPALAFVPQRRPIPSLSLSPPAFLPISTHFTAPPGVPQTPSSPKPVSPRSTFPVGPGHFTSGLTSRLRTL